MCGHVECEYKAICRSKIYIVKTGNTSSSLMWIGKRASTCLVNPAQILDCGTTCFKPKMLDKYHYKVQQYH